MLNDADLEVIKTELLKKQMRIPGVVKKLFPDENVELVRKQLFDKYGPREVMSWMEQPVTIVEPTKEQRISSMEQQLANIEKRKASLQEELNNLKKA